MFSLVPIKSYHVLNDVKHKLDVLLRGYMVCQHVSGSLTGAGGVMVSTSDSQCEGPGFNFQARPKVTSVARFSKVSINRVS